MFKFDPAVFAVNKEYQIFVRVDYESLMWIKIGDKCYYDDCNGILRSRVKVHKICVPLDELNKARKYTVCERKIIERKPYFSETEDIFEKEYDFIPVANENIRMYHIADAHNMVEQPVRACNAFGDFDILLLNGDVPDHSGEIENFDNIYDICSRLTHGNKPVLFSRGNHDLRGNHAEDLADYTPTENGKSYYTFRLGNMWGIILDCGEDKIDECAEYGNTICCHSFREKETEFIKNVIKNADTEYKAEGVEHIVVIAHNPFTQDLEPPFNIENEIYTEWCKLLREDIKPEIMICGHLHRLQINMPNSPEDHRGQPCPVAIVSNTDYKDYFAGGGFEFSKNHIQITCTNSNGEIELNKML